MPFAGRRNKKNSIRESKLANQVGALIPSNSISLGESPSFPNEPQKKKTEIAQLRKKSVPEFYDLSNNKAHVFQTKS